jgi:hypothetical protein
MLRTSAALLALVVALLLAGGSAAAPENPLQPLAAVAKHLEAGAAPFLEGKSAEEAWRPWKAAVAERGLDSVRPPLKAAGGVAMRAFYLELELHYMKGEERVHRVALDLWVTPESASVLEVRSRADSGDPPDGAFPTDTASEALRPFAAAAKGMDAALRGEGWEDVPMADAERLSALLEPALGADGTRRAVEDVAKARKALEKAAGEVKEVGADRVLVHADDQGFLAVDAQGKVVGMVSGDFDVSESGELSFTLQQYKGPPKKKDAQ